MEGLHATTENNASLLTILKSLHPDEWANLTQRINLVERQQPRDEQGDIIVASDDLTSADRDQASADSGIAAGRNRRLSTVANPDQLANDKMRRGELNPRTGSITASQQLMALRTSSADSASASGEPSSAGPKGNEVLYAQIRAAFQRHDVNGSGQLDYQELQKVLQELGMASDSHEAGRLVSAFDHSGDGLLSLDEFTRAMLETDEERYTRETTLSQAQETNKEKMEQEVQRWASDRSQVLSRTVRGMMRYGEALDTLAELEGVPSEDVKDWVDSKF
jgi:hypothetical protein